MNTVPDLGIETTRILGNVVLAHLGVDGSFLSEWKLQTGELNVAPIGSESAQRSARSHCRVHAEPERAPIAILAPPAPFVALNFGKKLSPSVVNS